MDSFLLIIGAMKSGTTSLFKYLADHPNIAQSREKEPDFFANEDNRVRSWSWYESLWDWDPARHTYAMEASPNYTKVPTFPNAAERIAAAPGRFKFIYIMRNPIERIESHYTHVQLAPPSPTTVHEHMLAVSSYARQLDEYYKRFPASDIKLLLFEDLRSRPVELMADICAFLDLESCFDRQRIGFTYNERKARIANPVIKRLRRSRAGRTLSALLPGDMRAQIKATIGLGPPNPVRLSPQQKEQVVAALTPDLRRLQNDYGVDVPRWGIDL